MQAVSAQHPRTPGPGLGYALKKESGSGRKRSQTILNSIVRGIEIKRYETFYCSTTDRESESE